MILTEPTMEYDAQIQAYRKDFLDAGSPAEGTGSVLRCATTREWLERLEQYRHAETLPPDGVPCTQYIYVRESDGKIVGMLQIRHPLNEQMEKTGGHIGYSVCPSERRRGYATRMLAAGLEKCAEMGISSVLVACVRENEASRRTILKNGGVYESTVYEPERDRYLERYRIHTKPIGGR